MSGDISRVRTRLEEEFAPRNAWRVALEEDGRISWTTAGKRQYRQPAPSRWSRIKEWFVALLPVRGEV